MHKLHLRIHFIVGFFMVLLALAYDLAQMAVDFISLGTLGWLINPLIDFWAFLTFYTWFKLLGVSFIRPSRAITLGATFFLELIPFLGDLPDWTLGVIILIAMTYAEDVLITVSPAAAQALAALLNPKELAKKK